MFRKLTDGNLSSQIKSALALNQQGNHNKVDSKQEFDALAKLLSGCEKDSEAYKHIDGLMIEYSKGNIVGNNNKTSVDNTVNQQGYGIVNGDNNSVNVTVNNYYTDQSRKQGGRLADILVGLSDGDKYPEVRRIINSDISSDNVMEILRGYEDQRPSASKFTNGDHFFEQLFTESGFDNKDKLIKTMARHLKGYFLEEGKQKIANEIDRIIGKSKLTKEDVRRLDNIYMKELGE